MKFLIATPDGRKFVSLYGRANGIFLTENIKLAMQFRSRSEADRFAMTKLNEKYLVIKQEMK